MTREEAAQALYAVKDELIERHFEFKGHVSAPITAIDMAIEALSADAVREWIPLLHDGLVTDFPYERDGEWVIVTDGKTISVERIKKDAYDHFFPNGRWFQLEDVVAWIPLPEPYREDGEA